MYGLKSKVVKYYKTIVFFLLCSASNVEPLWTLLQVAFGAQV